MSKRRVVIPQPPMDRWAHPTEARPAGRTLLLLLGGGSLLGMGLLAQHVVPVPAEFLPKNEPRPVAEVYMPPEPFFEGETSPVPPTETEPAPAALATASQPAEETPLTSVTVPEWRLVEAVATGGTLQLFPGLNVGPALCPT